VDPYMKRRLVPNPLHDIGVHQRSEWNE
jgi:hypothetical protein